MIRKAYTIRTFLPLVFGVLIFGFLTATLVDAIRIAIKVPSSILMPIIVFGCFTLCTTFILLYKTIFTAVALFKIYRYLNNNSIAAYKIKVRYQLLYKEETKVQTILLHQNIIGTQTVDLQSTDFSSHKHLLILKYSHARPTYKDIKKLNTALFHIYQKKKLKEKIDKLVSGITEKLTEQEKKCFNVKDIFLREQEIEESFFDVQEKTFIDKNYPENNIKININQSIIHNMVKELMNQAPQHIKKSVVRSRNFQKRIIIAIRWKELNSEKNN